MDKIHKQFTNPDAFYRPAPFWIWNEEMDSKETVRQLKEMKEHGFGGGFAHVRLGLITEYMSDEFLDVWGETLEGAKDMGSILYMYDEYAWPSGFAGGEVMEACPETVMTWAEYEIIDTEWVNPNRKYYTAYVFDEENNEVKECIKDVPLDEWKNYGKKVLAIWANVCNDNSCGRHTYVDLTNPKVTEKFIEFTHEKYKARFGKDFKDHIKAIFSDEASVFGFDDRKFVYSEVIKDKFREMHGYNLEDNLPAVYEDFKGKFDKDPAKVRYDYNCTISELWIESFVKPISKWCEENGIAWCGHDQEHSWPQTRGGAFSLQRTYEYRQWPGMDMLLCDALRDVPSWNDTLLMNEIRTAANQFSKERTLVEAYGAAGWHSTLDDYKRIGDWLWVNGLNFMCQHLTHYSIVGARKRDCPQSIDWRQPWWNEYTEQNDYFSRLSYLLSQGKMEQRIMMLNTTTSSYVIPVSKQKGMINHMANVDCIKNPDMSDFLTVMQKLIDEQWDFDIGDEFSIANNAVINGKKFTVGAESYDVIIVSKNMLNMRKETAELLKKFIANGGTVLSTGDAATYISGEKLCDITDELRKSWTVVDGAEGINKVLSEMLPRRIVSDRPIPTGVNHMRRVLDDGREVYFFVNHAMETYEASFTVNGTKAAIWDPYTGTKKALPCTVENGKLTFNFNLERNQSLLIVVGDDAEFIPEKPKATKEVELKKISIAPELHNDLLLDHSVLITEGDEPTPERYYIQAEETLYGRRDYGNDIWRHTIPFRDEFHQKNKFGKGSGFECIYAVDIEEGCVPTEIYAVIERPDLFNLRVNGNETKWTGEGHILDYKIGRIDVAPYVKEGRNEFVLWADVFDMRMELESIILEGEFGVTVNADDRFIITKKQDTFDYGSWIDQGYRFYPNAFIYKYEAELDKKPESARIVVGKYESSAVSVTVNGKYAGLVGKNGSMYAEIGDFLEEGKNEIALRACASFRNLYGPHLNYPDQTVADQGQFERHNKKRINYASEYDQIHYGLFEAPKLFVNE